eukprot:TRINITY_DN9973_c0_g1_i1.p1 TRINITY_DN9973_c0_g1~~TRINITY_DN9973_c0_g1_i1.p1  ORF type:complete len:130 (-),score=42.60 TRINITY_DN9973_c0_g1_i1:73-462(-)
MAAPKNDNDVEVTWEDQKMINMFGRLNNKIQDLRYELKVRQTDLEDLQEAENEIIVSDETIVKYRVGEIYVGVEQSDAEEMISKETQKAKEDVANIEKEIDSIKNKMNELKVKLYAKFGGNINLEEGDD